MSSDPQSRLRSSSSLAVRVDGAKLPEAEARAFWARFSAYMEVHKGDLRGFAEAEGFASVHPEMSPEGAVLVASLHAVQKPYENVSGGDEASDNAGAAGRARAVGARATASPMAVGNPGPTRGSSGAQPPRPSVSGAGTRPLPSPTPSGGSRRKKRGRRPA